MVSNDAALHVYAGLFNKKPFLVILLFAFVIKSVVYLIYQKRNDMTTQPNINGVTFNQITSLMNKYEKIIMWYNRKYNYDMSNAKPKEQKEYASMQNAWENARAKRDQLKTELFKAAA